MKKITHSATLAYTAKQMYDLVNDIESYPDFLPWCTNASIQEQTATEVHASLTIAKAGFEKTFATRNYLVENESMKLTLVDGPFKHFEGLWHFSDVENGQCQVVYTMEFEFSNMFIGMVAEPIFAQIADSMINAFKEQAAKVYHAN